MRAMVLRAVVGMDENPAPLELVEVVEPVPGPHEILVAVSVCGVCHTELDEIEGRTPPPALPVIPGHEIVGRVAAFGANSRRFDKGDRVGIGAETDYLKAGLQRVRDALLQRFAG